MNAPPVPKPTTPADVVLSPQLIVAVKSLSGARAYSVNEPTTPLNWVPATAVIGAAGTALTWASVTVAVEVSEARLPPRLMTRISTL